MASRYPASTGHVEPMEVSDSEALHSISDDAPSETNPINRRLEQAVLYLQEEGGDDSPATFVDRVNRIDNGLLQVLAHQGHSFDHKLYRRVRALVLDAQRDFDEAVGEEILQSEFREDDLGYYDPSLDEEALYRSGSSDDSSSPSPSTDRPTQNLVSKPSAEAPRQIQPKTNAERQRVFRYGGPGNEPENWNKNFPNSLPFPETLLMAHWESLKIDYDLSRPKTGSAVETNVPFDHVELQPYFNLSLYESGSRFKLPSVSEDDQRLIATIGSLNSVDEILDEFYYGAEFEEKDYVPRVFLERLTVGQNQNRHVVHTVLANELREAHGSSPSPKTDQRPQTPKQKPPRPQQGLTGRSLKGRSSPAFRAIDKEIQRSRGLRPKNVTPRPASKPIQNVTPAPTPNPGRNPIVTSGSVGTNPKVVIGKRGPGRPRKTPPPDRATGVEPIIIVDESENEDPTQAGLYEDTPSKHALAIVVEPPKKETTPTKSSLGKRRNSNGSQPYKPVAPTKSAIKKDEHQAKKARASPGKSVGFVDNNSDDAAETRESDDGFNDSSPVKPFGKATAKGGRGSVGASKPVGKNTAAPVAKKTVTPVKKTAAPVVKKVNKAAAAGQQAKTRATSSRQTY